MFSSINVSTDPLSVFTTLVAFFRETSSLLLALLCILTGITPTSHFLKLNDILQCSLSDAPIQRFPSTFNEVGFSSNIHACKQRKRFRQLKWVPTD